MFLHFISAWEKKAVRCYAGFMLVSLCQLSNIYQIPTLCQGEYLMCDVKVKHEMYEAIFHHRCLYYCWGYKSTDTETARPTHTRTRAHIHTHTHTHTQSKEGRDKTLIWQYSQKMSKWRRERSRRADFITGDCSEGKEFEAWVELREIKRHGWRTKQPRQEVQSLQPWITVTSLNIVKS